jgi:DNA-binding response OmpR family regulator
MIRPMARVLLVEDDEVIALGMLRHVEAAGFSAERTASGEDGLARLRDSAPDVCVLDLMLPGLSGWQVIEIARAEGISTPLIVVSARGSEVERNRALTLGASAYLIKPFPMRTLVAQVRTTLEGGRAGATSAAPTWLLPGRAGADARGEQHA